MDKKHYVLYLLPSRAGFMQTMTEEEKGIMQQHVAYWATYLEQGVMLVFGPVFDPNGGYGMGIIEVDDEQQLKALLEKDPASKINKYEYYPMRAVTRKK
jgi:uncharacterized protein YciI